MFRITLFLVLMTPLSRTITIPLQFETMSQLSTLAFTLSVYVGDEPLKEYCKDDKTYIEANLHSSSSYIIEDFDDEGYKQQYPVTPFEVRGTFTNALKFPCYLKLCVDGQQIWMKPFAPNNKKQKFRVSGVKDPRNGIVKELLFSLPKISSQKDTSSKIWCEELGTITLECLEAVDDGYYQTYNKQFFPLDQKNLSHNTKHHHATKYDCTKNGGIGMSTREGREYGAFYTSNQLITMKRYRLGSKKLGKITLHYRPRVILEELGIVDRASDQKTTRKINKSNQRHGTDINDNMTSSSGQENTDNIKIETEINKQIESSVMDGAASKAVKQEIINNDKSLDTVISRFNEMMTDPSPSSQKMYCFSPSQVRIKKETMNLTSDEKLGCYSPSHKQSKFMEPCQIKKEVIGDEEKQYRYIEIDDDVMMLQEVDDDVVWMGDDSCCFIDVEPEEVPVIDLV